MLGILDFNKILGILKDRLPNVGHTKKEPAPFEPEDFEGKVTDELQDKLILDDKPPGDNLEDIEKDNDEIQENSMTAGKSDTVKETTEDFDDKLEIQNEKTD